MAYVICDPCAGAKDKACVDVCPIDCIHEGRRMLYINPAECIDCGACAPACPVGAIYLEADVPPQWTSCIAENAAFFETKG